jgi:radical SAM superfamily enzyme YgiQ (UPF0313 family)
LKLLFVNPSLRPDAPIRYLPVGLGYVVTSVKEAGFDFDLLDIDIGGYSDDQVEKFVATNKYDVVALGSIVTHYRWIKWFVRTVKRYQPGCKVIVGNSVGGSIPEILFHYAPVDIVVVGEGDVTIVEVLQHLNDGKSLGEADIPLVPLAHTNGDLPPTVKGNGVAGIVFRDAHGRIVNNERRKAAKFIDEFPYPDWDIFDVESYIEMCRGSAHDTVRFPKEEAVVVPVNTARGCVFKCTFCHYVFWDDPYRHRSAESIIGEIRRNKKKYGANYINFWDELSFHKLNVAERFVDHLIGADLDIHWTAAVRSDLFGRDDIPYDDRRRVAEKFLDSGCVAVGYSLESGSDEILEAMNKRIKADYFGEQVSLLREVGIISNTSVVIGYPQETPETIAATMTMCEKNWIYPSVGYLLPLPSTGMWRHAVDNGFITAPDKFLTEMTERQDFVLNMTQMPEEQLRGEVTRWLKHLNQVFGNILEDEDLIRTGGENKHGKVQEEAIQSHRNSADTQNYAMVAGSL